MPIQGTSPTKTYVRSDGVRTGAAVNSQADTAGVNDTAALADTRENDFATAINACVFRTGENQPSANLPMNDFIHTGVGQGSARTHYTRIDQVQDGDLVWGGTAGGTGDEITVGLTPDITAYVAGLTIVFLASADNTGATTINADSVGAKAIQVNGAALTGGEIQSDQIHRVTYDGTAFQLENPSISATTLALLASTSNGNGASLIGIEDSAGNFTATDVEAALAETLNASSGKHTVVIPASAMIPATTSGAAPSQIESSSNKINYIVLDFDDEADEYAHFNIAMPKGWNEGAITFRAFWSTTATDTDGVAWGLQGVAVTDGESIDASWGTGVVVTDDAQGAAGDILVTSESSAVTIGGTPAEGDICFFRVYRDVSDANDDMTEDARLIAIQLFFTTDSPTDD